MDALEAIAQRHSTRSFRSDPVPQEIVEKIVDAGRFAATGRNEQPCEFVVVTDPIVRRRIADLTDYGKFIADAPVCVALFCYPTTYYLEDGSAAAQTMLIAAAALGVQSCWVSGDKRPYAQAVAEVLRTPRSHKLVALIPLGYEAAPTPRAPKRKLSEILHWERF